MLFVLLPPLLFEDAASIQYFVFRRVCVPQGGGIIQCTFLTALGTMPQSEVIATTLAGTFILNSSAATVYYRLGHVNVRGTLLIAGAGAVLAAATSLATVAADEATLRKWLAAMMVLSSVGFFR